MAENVEVKKENPRAIEPVSPFPNELFQESIQEFPKADISGAGEGGFWYTLNLAAIGDGIPQWGTVFPHARDKALREFYYTRAESFLQGAIYSIATRNAAFRWEIETENDRLREVLTSLFKNALVNNTRGWVPFMEAFSQDLYMQDNGAFIELIRDESPNFRNERAPVIGIGHLDSGQCTRTGNPQFPVIFEDEDGKKRKLAWYEVIPFSEYPSPLKRMRGVGFCAVSRVLQMAQILRNIAIFKDEKVSGRHYRAIHFIGGVSKSEINDIMESGQEDADNKGLMRYIMPQMVASLDPEKPVSTATIDLAALPDNFDLDTEMRWYIAALALGTGTDYQDLAPLSSSSMGSGNQSEILHRKSRGKGPAAFMQMFMDAMHHYGVLPKNATFVFGEKDMAEELEEQELRTKRAEERAIYVRSGVIPPHNARLALNRDGYLTDEELAAIPEDYGVDIVNRNTGPDQQRETTGDTISEDVRRVSGK